MQRLIRGAVAEGRYGEVARLAEIAELVRGAVSRVAPGKRVETAPLPLPVAIDPLEPQGIRGGESQPTNCQSERPLATNGASVFPKFEADGERLVKIGWSKKDKTIYEHRALRVQVLATCMQLANVSADTIFRMDDILPISLPDGTDVPLYQAYLVLAWLRHIGLVEKKGKDGYRWTVDSFNEEAFKSAWESTPRRV